MEKSKVYFTDMRTDSRGENLPEKFERLLYAAGIDGIDFKNKYAAIKVHFGEPGNLAMLRPAYARVVADVVKRLGGKPFLTDCNTLYVGGRKNALDHIDAAYENGFNPFCTGCHVIIGDGLKGTDEALVPIEGGEYVKEAKIGRAVMDADIVISLNHFKCHENTGIGGALKNIGMGCGSRAGKMEMHSLGKPFVSAKRCVRCGSCLKVCAHGAIAIDEESAKIDQVRCVGCGRCIGVCPVDAVRPEWSGAREALSKKIAEYTYAVLKDKPSFHATLAIDISPYCDCHSENDVPIVGDVGMFASLDPVAIDVACADAVNKSPVNPSGALAKHKDDPGDRFMAMHPTTNWRVCPAHAEKLGLGSMAYELVKI